MNYARILGFWLALSLAAHPLLAQKATPLPAGVTQTASVEGITEYKLNNGLRILLFPDPSKPQVTVNLTVLVGSRHDHVEAVGAEIDGREDLGKGGFAAPGVGFAGADRARAHAAPGAQAEKEEPQPQAAMTFGLSTLKPAPWRPST